jgi:sugar (pentulose or hexulose) kinase
MARIAVVDIGKTTAKLAVIDTASGATLETIGQPNRPLPGPPYPQADVARLWLLILGGLARLGRAHRIDGIAVTTHGATAALVHGEDLALPVLDYEYGGPDSLADAYDAARPAFVESLSPRLPAGLNLGAQLFWQARAFPEAFARTEAILTYPQFWAWRLSGVAASEVTSLGCHTDLWNPAAGRLSSLVEREGWTGRFPPLRRAAEAIGGLRPEVAAATGLPASTPVACGIHDSNASLLPWLRRFEPPFTVVSSGTWTVVMTVGGGLDGLDPGRDSLANVDAFGRPVPTARFMGGREYALLLGEEPVQATPADVARVIARKVFALPPVVPAVGPFQHGPGGWAGDPARLDPGERSAAADLYLALCTRACLGLAGLGRAIVIEGPLARNPVYCGLVAALTGRPVHPSPDATGTAIGAAMLLADAPAAAALPPAIAPLRPRGLGGYAERWLARSSAVARDHRLSGAD